MLTVYVDLPSYEESDTAQIAAYKNVATFVGNGAKEKALEFVRTNWAADEEGRVNLLSIHEEPDEDYGTERSQT